MHLADETHIPGLIALGVEADEVHRRRIAAQRAGKSSYLVAHLDGEIVGHVVVRWLGSVHDHVRVVLGSVPEVRRLRVAHWHQGKGLGKKILQAAEAFVVDKGFPSLSLCVGVGNHVARGLYRSAGYRSWEEGSFKSSWSITAVDGSLVSVSHQVEVMTKSLDVDLRALASDAALQPLTCSQASLPSDVLAGSCSLHPHSQGPTGSPLVSSLHSPGKEVGNQVCHAADLFGFAAVGVRNAV